MTLFVGTSTANSTIEATSARIVANSTATALFVSSAGAVGVGTESPTQKFTINGIGNATGDFRAPVFYDSNNTGYYANPAGSSLFNEIYSSQYRILNGGVFIWQHDSAAANNKYWDTYSASDGSLYFRAVNDTYTAATGWLSVSRSGISPQVITLGGSYTTAAGSVRSPIFYDSDNTAYYIDGAGTSVLNGLTVGGLNPVLKTQNLFSGSADDISAPISFLRDGVTFDDYIIKHSSARGFFSKPGHGWHNRTESCFHIFSSGWVTNFGVNTDGVVRARSDFRAPIFYDSDNTAYYVNPNDWTKIAGLWTDWGAITFQSTQHKRITSNDGAGNWNFRAGNYVNGPLQYINNGANSGAATITFACDSSDGAIAFYTAPIGVAGANVTYTGTAAFDRYGTWSTSGDFRAPIFYDSNNTAYYSDPNGTSVLTRVSLWSGTTSALHVNDVAGASSYNFIMSAANDGGTKLVAFVNGSTRNTDGGNNAVVIRNDGGPFILGSASYATTVTGSTVTVPTDLIVSGGADGIQLNNGTSNYITWGSAGVAAPTFTTRSAGTKLVLYPNLGASAADYALGIENNTLWSSIPTTTQQFKWYAGTTNVMTLSGAGVLTLNHGVGATNLTDGFGLVLNNNYTDGRYSHRLRKWDDGGGVPLYVQYTVGTAGTWSNLAKFGPNTADASFLRTYGYAQFDGSVRAPIFYDSDDTTVRFTGNELVLRGVSPTVYFRDNDGSSNSAMIHVNSNTFYVLRGTGDTETWSTVGGVWPLYINLNNNAAVFGGAVSAASLSLTTALPVASGGTGVTTSTGSGNVVLSTSPTLVTPILGTPQSGNFSTGTFTWPTFNQNTTGSAASLSATLVETSGGTGQSTYTTGDILYADASNSLGKLAGVATGNALISGGVGVAPSWGKIGLTTHISGTLAVGNGGTGVTTSTGSGNVVLSNSPTLVTPALGTPASGNLANCTFPTLNQNTTGSAGSVANALTINNGGSGAASGSTYNGSAAVTISHNSIGAVALAGSTMTGLLIGKADASANVSVSNDGGSFSVRGSSTTPATMSFHRPSAYAVNVGLDTDNVFKIGGWSDGVNAYRMQLGAPGGNHTLNGNLTVTGSGSKTLIATLTASNSATVSTTALSGYRYYEIIFTNIVPVTTSTILQLRWYASAAYQTTGYQNYIAIFNGGGSASYQPTTYVDLSGGGRVSSTASNGFTGRVLLTNADEATGFKQYIIDSGGLDSSTAGYCRCWGTGQLNVTAAITGFQMYMSSGNISTGVIEIWGWN